VIERGSRSNASRIISVIFSAPAITQAGTGSVSGAAARQQFVHFSDNAAVPTGGWFTTTYTDFCQPAIR